MQHNDLLVPSSSFYRVLQVGNRLGAGDSTGAKAAAAAAISVAPFAWALAVIPLIHPASQAWLIHAFSDPGQEREDPLLESILKHMFQVICHHVALSHADLSFIHSDSKTKLYGRGLFHMLCNAILSAEPMSI